MKKFKLADAGYTPHYRANGYNNREEYIAGLCDEYDADKVIALADLLGPSEDFDGLITMLEDDC